MKKIYKVVAVLLSAMLFLMSCSPKGEDLTHYNSLLDQDDFLTLSKLSEEEYLEILSYDTLGDYLGASPFYISEGQKKLFNDQSYFESHRAVVDKLLFRAKNIEEAVNIAFLHQMDYVFPTVLTAYEEVAKLDPNLKSHFGMLTEEYEKNILHISILASQLEEYKEHEGRDDYTKAWLEYIQVYKSIDLGEATLRFVTRVIQDGLILEEEYLERIDTSSDAWYSINNMIVAIESLEHQDLTAEIVMLDIVYLLEGLKAIEDADAYLTLSLLQSMISFSEGIEGELKQLKPTEELTGDMIQLAIDANEFQLELSSFYAAQLVEGYGLDEASVLKREIAITPEESHTKEFALPIEFNLIGRAYATNGNIDSQIYYQKAKEVITTPDVGEVKNTGFFSSIKNKVLSLPGKIVEKSGNFVYNTVFDVFATNYGVDTKTIAKEKARVLEEEKRRIKNGEAGAEVYENSIKLIEKYVENPIGDAAEYFLGEDSTSAKIIKEGSKFAIGCFTGASKSLITVLNPKSTNADLIKATVNIALTTSAGAAVVDKVVNTGIKKTLSFGGKITKSITDITGPLVSKTMNSVGRVKDMVVKNTGELADKIVSAVSKSPKTKQMTSLVYDKSVAAINKTGGYISDMFASTTNRLSAFGSNIQRKLTNINNLTTINNDLIKNAIGNSSGNVIKGYIQGLVFDSILDIEDTTIANLPKDYEEEEILLAGLEEEKAEEGEAEEGEEDYEDIDEDDQTHEEDSIAKNPTQPAGITGNYKGQMTVANLYLGGGEYIRENINDPCEVRLTSNQLYIKGGFDGDQFELTFSELTYSNNTLYSSTFDHEQDLMKVEIEFKGNGQIEGRVIMHYVTEYIGSVLFKANRQ